MSLGTLFQWEWLIIELIVLGILVWQLISVNREIRRAKEEEERAEPLSDGASGTEASAAPTPTGNAEDPGSRGSRS